MKNAEPDPHTPVQWMILAGSALACWILAMTIDLSHLELGALSNAYVPPAAGVISFIVFIVFRLVSKRAQVRWTAVVVPSVANVCVGLALRWSS